MGWKVRLNDRAKKHLKKLDQQVATRISNRRLASDLFNQGRDGHRFRAHGAAPSEVYK
jgi:mRNA-degrading endonuclease RelE of RelBE toxin-antitoxin system